MKIALFIPCYVDAFFPEVGIATLELLEKLGVEVEYPLDQTCCGQPMANSGLQAESASVEQLFVDTLTGYDHIVIPSGSCTHHVRDHLDAIDQTPEVSHIRANTYELVEYLHDVLKVEGFPWTSFPHKVGLHNACSSLRGIGHAKPSELMTEPFSKTEDLLRKVEGLQLIEPDRPDECCGFGGTFSVTEEAVSARMGLDKVSDHFRNGAEYITSADMSCLMHQKGIAERGGIGVKFVHIAEILNGGSA